MINKSALHMRFITIVIGLAMPVASSADITVGANMRSVVHKNSNGVNIAFPDVCKTPSPAGPVPIPYPNQAITTAENAKKTKVVRYSLRGKTRGRLNFRQTAGKKSVTTATYIDAKGKKMTLREPALFKLANGDFCAVCAAKNGTVTAVYRLRSD